MKLKAFTIVEVLVGLLIGSIVIVLAVFSYAQIHKLHLGFENENMRNASYKRLHYLMDHDIGIATRIRYTETNDGLYMVYTQVVDSHPFPDSICYRFGNDAVYRIQHEREDTFHFIFSSLQTKMSKIKGDLITQISVIVGQDEWIFDKQYPSKVLLENELNKSTNWQ